MKQTYFKKLLFLCFIIVCCFGTAQPVSAQIEELSLRKNDSLALNMSGYNQGDIQWQRYSPLLGWSNIPSATTPQLRTKLTSSTRFRARVTDAECGAYYSDSVQVNFWDEWAGSAYKLNGGRAYVYPYVSSNPGLTVSENGTLRNWTSSARKAVWYLYQQAGTYDFGFILNLSNNQTRNFKITCSPAFDGLDFETASRDFSYIGKGKSDTLVAITTTFPKTGYYRYELESKNTSGTITISELYLKGYSKLDKSISVAPHTTDYLSSPSVHLHYKSQENGSSGDIYDWIYQEVLVPEGSAAIYTYWESIGFSGGYLGLQDNTDTQRRILFSIWDQIDVDYYKKIGRTPPPDSLVSLVDKADYITSNGFGNEGTGGQSYFPHQKTWKEGHPVKFLFNVRKDEDACAICPSGRKPTVILSAWYCAYDENDPTLTDIPMELKGWRYIASWRRPFVNSYQGFTGSFLENFGYSNGHLARKGYYYNTYGRVAGSGRWIHHNQATGSNTDGAIGQRIDYEHGVSTDEGHDDKFYMLSGGYGNTKKGNLYTVPLKTIENFPYLRDLDMEPFTRRVDEAIAKEHIQRVSLKALENDAN